MTDSSAAADYVVVARRYRPQTFEGLDLANSTLPRL